MDSPGGDGKPARRKAGNAAGRKDVGRVKLTLVLSPEAAGRIAIHAAMTGQSKSALVERLASEHLRRFVVSDREKEKEKPPPAPPSAA